MTAFGRKAAVIDDSDNDRLMMRKRLQDVGYEVESADRPENLGDGPYAIALVDMVYNGDPSGPAFCGSLRERWPTCLIIAVSSVDERDTHFLRAIEEGACTQLEKEYVTNRILTEIIRVHWCEKHPTRP